MADLAADPVNPHNPTDECWPAHCFFHHVDEPDDGAYRVCFECKHVYRTAEALREAWAEVAVDAGVTRLALHVIAPPAEEIYGCPYCCHDF